MADARSVYSKIKSVDYREISDTKTLYLQSSEPKGGGVCETQRREGKLEK